MRNMHKNTKWFTLVELIIVITILAVLGTIGLVSYQWFTSDARDSKRVSDISSLWNALETKRAGNSITFIAFVEPITANQVLSGIQTWSWIAGTGVIRPTNYDAWKVKFELLWVSPETFKDPKWVDYAFGATTLKGGHYQFAATLEKWETPVALVKWSYSERTADSLTGVVSPRNGKIFELANTADFGKLMVADTVTLDCGTDESRKIVSISNDLKYITVDGTTDMNTSCTSIALGQSEMEGLIWWTDTSSATWIVVTDGGTVKPY